jgi:hypothetical protein
LASSKGAVTPKQVLEFVKANNVQGYDCTGQTGCSIDGAGTFANLDVSYGAGFTKRGNPTQIQRLLTKRARPVGDTEKSRARTRLEPWLSGVALSWNHGGNWNSRRIGQFVQVGGSSQ